MLKWLRGLFPSKVPNQTPLDPSESFGNLGFNAAEYCRQCEATATWDQRRAVTAMAFAHGWEPGSNPPAWVWMMIWDHVLGRSPVTPPTNTVVH